MNWFDIFSILFLILIAYIGSKRGLILELFDLIVLTIGFGVTLHLYQALARFILSFLARDKTFCYWFSFFLVFIIIAGLLMFIALLLDKSLKLAVILSPLNSYGGLFVALCKAIIVLVMILMLILAIPMKKEDKKNVFNSIMAKAVWNNFYQPVKDIFDIVTPTFVNDYVNDIIKKSKIIKS